MKENTQKDGGTVAVQVVPDLSAVRSLLEDMLAVVDKHDGEHASQVR